MSEDVNMGNLHHFGKTIVNSLNKEINAEGYAGGKLVWHNDEAGNPFSPGFDENDKPIFFLPSGGMFQAKIKVNCLVFIPDCGGVDTLQNIVQFLVFKL